MQKLKDKVAYVTGGSKGIGRGIVGALLNEGMKVAFSSRRNTEGDIWAQQYGTDRVLGLDSDVRQMESEQEAVNRVLEAFGQLDVVIANAGVGFFAPIEEMTDQQWRQTIDTNLTGVFHTTKASVPSLIKSKGYLITIASLAGTNFFEKGAAYNASKFGLVGFTQAVMLDLRKKGVKVSTIMPGSVASHFNDNIPGPKDDWKIQPSDIGQLVVDLLQMEARTLPSKVEVRPSFPHLKSS